MQKSSKKKKKILPAELPPPKDLSKLPDEVQEIVELKKEKITASAKLTFDGYQYLVRIPTRIARVMQFSKNDEFEFEVDNPLPTSKENPKIEIRLKRG